MSRDMCELLHALQGMTSRTETASCQTAQYIQCPKVDLMQDVSKFVRAHASGLPHRACALMAESISVAGYGLQSRHRMPYSRIHIIKKALLRAVF